ncbi:hypothetical protein P9Z96_35685, partial [Bacillus cereus]|nr:hypothetical protein [Bacillus cereus]MED2484077.1 hypothetical protein [Bacillus thuringiensis]MED2496897.1 hypothetical protein [Bacillus thuringiensis]
TYYRRSVRLICYETKKILLVNKSIYNVYFSTILLSHYNFSIITVQVFFICMSLQNVKYDYEEFYFTKKFIDVVVLQVLLKY